MSRGGDNSGGVRKKHRANSMGLQWWRKLTLPRRGKKDSVLVPSTLTEHQKQRLEDRLSALRKAILAPRAARQKHMAAAAWDSKNHVARVVTPRGNSMQSMGFFDDGEHCLFPEEALFLVDKGTLDLYVDGLPASLQRAWALAMTAPNSITLEEFLTFAHLRRAGYVVRRYEAEDDGQSENLRLSFSAWRVGSFKRKENIRPLFHVAVFRHETHPPAISAIERCLETSGRSRLKIAVIDRGVVVLTDAATNATPLSDRFVKRLPESEQEVARKIRAGDVGNIVLGESQASEH